MLAINGKEYNLEILFQYETLKEVLMALAKNNLEMKDNIDSLQINNKEKDKKIEELENKIKSMNEYNEEKFNNIEMNFNNFKGFLNKVHNQNDNKDKSTDLLQIEKENQKEINLTDNNDNIKYDNLISQDIITQLGKKISENKMRIEELEKNTKDLSEQTEMNDLENKKKKKIKEKNIKNKKIKKNLKNKINN